MTQHLLSYGKQDIASARLSEMCQVHDTQRTTDSKSKYLHFTIHRQRTAVRVSRRDRLYHKVGSQVDKLQTRHVSRGAASLCSVTISQLTVKIPAPADHTPDSINSACRISSSVDERDVWHSGNVNHYSSVQKGWPVPIPSQQLNIRNK